MSALIVRGLLFTDIQGSTELVRRLGDRYADVLERHHAIIRTSAAGHSGAEQSREGDSLFITFPSATAALGAALDAQRQIEREAWPLDGRVRVRMGLHVGEVAESRAGLVGLAIHQAARIMSAGHGGQIVVSGDVLSQAQRLPGGASTRLLGTYDLRDVGRMPLHQVLHADLPDDFPELRTTRALVHNLPSPLTSLVGRRAETEAVWALLEEHRLVTLLGEGGCGKTRLALRVAAAGLSRFVDGVWFVDLAPLSAGTDVISRVALVLGVDGETRDVVSALHDKHALVVLDNCEHVVDSVAGLVAELLSESATCHVVATSRTPLDVAGEARYHVPVLELPRPGAELREVEAAEAVQLFVARARLAVPDFRLSEKDVKPIVELCARLEGLPLAIELAAARLRVMSLDELVGRINQRFGVLVGGSRSLPERHQTLRNTMEWSFRLLDADERHVLHQLCAFRGGCDVEGAMAVSGAEASPETTLEVLSSLVDKSLVTARTGDGPTRYDVHESIREYDLEVAAAESELARERHARWFVQLAASLSRGPSPGGERDWLRRHDEERDNLLAAAEWLLVHDGPAALRFLIALEPGVDLTMQRRWISDLVGRALPLATDAPASDRATALSMLAWDASDQGNEASAQQLVAEAVELLGAADHPEAEAYVLSAVAKYNAERTGGRLDDADVAAAVVASDRVGGTFWPIMQNYFLSVRAPPSIAEALLNDGLHRAEQLSLGYFGSLMQSSLVVITQFRDESSIVLAAWRQLFPLLDELAIYEGNNADFYALAEGEHDELAVGVHIAEDFLLRLNHRPHDPRFASGLAAVLAHLRRLAGDLEGSQSALEVVNRGGPPRWDFVGGLALITRSSLSRERGQPQAAFTAIQLALRHLGYQGLTDISMRVVEEVAAVALALGRRDGAADLLATAREWREREHRPLSPACRPQIDALTAALHGLRGRPLALTEMRSLIRSLDAATMD